ncbi:GMP synthase (glutamine-hydrolyzing) [Lepraria neglecta]|uniref:GMP synthase [glutamine-hydrolyzing] n=1 Tax=Lepraria neglecta TaxID=209136 RepID=A0AAD9ZCX3_9LECA|nr:GMP synthase (glutamine-hydrolyzing) [Lepraria neglecta]
MEEFVGKEISRIRALVGEKGQVIGAVSGGVDSTVDNGLLRQDEAKIVHKTLTDHLGIQLTVVDASQRFLGELKGVTDPEQKRKTIGRNFIEVFQEEAHKLEKAAANSLNAGDIEWLLQGTLQYPDVIESISFKGPSQTIKSHHNVGGLPAAMHLKLIEPLRELFKDEVRILGTKLGIPEHLVWRHPFPGPGLAIRVLGEVTEPQLRIVRQADKIFIDELVANDLYRKTSQAFAALLPVRAVGVMGDKREHGQIISLRALTVTQVETTDFMTAVRTHFDIENRTFLDRVSSRITNEVEGVTRVLYDITSKPPANMSGTSNVGGRGVYEAGDQRNMKDSEINEAERYKEGQPNSHLANDSKDERTIANKLAREEKRQNEPEPTSKEAEESRKDPTLPAKNHGNEPSKGAKIDAEIQAEEEEMLKKKGAFGPKT